MTSPKVWDPGHRPQRTVPRSDRRESVKPYLSAEMRTRLQDSWHRTYKMDIWRTLDFRDSPVRTPRQNPAHASWPAACAANWARNVAVAPSTPGFRARPYWQIRRPCCSRWYPREPDNG